MAVLSGLGALSMAYFVQRIDASANQSMMDFNSVHSNTDMRLEKLEQLLEDDSKETKKLDFKTKMLCKFANLFNNPTYQICNTGFDAVQVRKQGGRN
jgi:hypothetical protein